MTTMSFGDILEAWERGRRPAGDMNAALDRDREQPAREEPGWRRILEPQAELDLHGLSGAEAEEALERFLRDARARGLKKVLIIHGKGHHSPRGPVLPRTVRAYLEKCPFAGAFGSAEPRLGGRGATWVVLKSGTTAPGR
jgi:DNA-nicking Smr family endonuclease